MSQLGMRVDSWRGAGRLARDLTTTGWAWSEKYGDVPMGKLSVDFTPDLWPTQTNDPLTPMGQTLHAEITLDGQSTALPPCRIKDLGDGASVDADTLDQDIADDPWPYPSSPPEGASLLQEATRLAAPLVVRLSEGVADARLAEGFAWSGARESALLELAAARSARWEMQADGSMLLVPLGSPTEPERTYQAHEVIDAPRKRSRDQINKVTVVVKGTEATEGTDEEPGMPEVPERILTRMLPSEEYAPEVYGVIGSIVELEAGASGQEIADAADALLAGGGAEREFTILPDPTLRAGMVVRLYVEHPAPVGREVVVGRVISHTLTHDGTHTITLRMGMI